MTLGLDIGGTYFRYELRKDEKTLKDFSIKSSEVDLKKYIEDILDEQKDIKNICISFAGQIKDGVIISSPNIKIENFDIKSYFEDKYSVKLFIQNDLNCAVLAESKFFDSKDVCAVYIGTGLGLGVLSSSLLVSGFDSMATELGHIPYKQSPFKCGCGKSNCIELFASGTALKKWKNYNNLDDSLTLKELQGTQVYDEFIEALLYAIGTTISLFNPEILVLGGGISTNNKYLCDIVIEKIKEYALPISLKNIQIKNTSIKNASLEGAFLLKDYHV